MGSYRSHIVGVRSCKNAFSRCCGWVCVRSVHAYAFLNACAHVGMRVVCVRDRPNPTRTPPTPAQPSVLSPEALCVSESAARLLSYSLAHDVARVRGTSAQLQARTAPSGDAALACTALATACPSDSPRNRHHQHGPRPTPCKARHPSNSHLTPHAQLLRAQQPQHCASPRHHPQECAPHPPRAGPRDARALIWGMTPRARPCRLSDARLCCASTEPARARSPNREAPAAAPLHHQALTRRGAYPASR